MCLLESPSSDAVLHGLRRARDAGVPRSLDLNLRGGLVDDALSPPFADTLWQAVRLSTCVLGSAVDEIPYMTHTRSMDDAVRRLADDGRTVVARHGADGATLVSATERRKAPSFPVRVVDTLGAGDAFDAGFIAARLEGLEMAEAVGWGNAVAALSTARAGARGGPCAADVRALLSAGEEP